MAIDSDAAKSFGFGEIACKFCGAIFFKSYDFSPEKVAGCFDKSQETKFLTLIRGFMLHGDFATS
jgi:hypothetical protein